MDNTATVLIATISMFNSSDGGLTWDPNACNDVTFFECASRGWPLLVVALVVVFILWLNKNSR